MSIAREVPFDVVAASLILCVVALHWWSHGAGEEFTAKRLKRVRATAHDRDFVRSKLREVDVDVTRAHCIAAVMALAGLTGKRPSSYVSGAAGKFAALEKLRKDGLMQATPFTGLKWRDLEWFLWHEGRVVFTAATGYFDFAKGQWYGIKSRQRTAGR